jgi:hypothetical protein
MPGSRRYHGRILCITDTKPRPFALMSDTSEGFPEWATDPRVPHRQKLSAAGNDSANRNMLF